MYRSSPSIAGSARLASKVAAEIRAEREAAAVPRARTRDEILADPRTSPATRAWVLKLQGKGR